MTPTEIIPWLTLVLSSLAVLGHLKGFFSSGEKKLEADIKSGREEIALLGKDIEAHETKLISLDRRTQAIEGEMRHLPDRESQHRLELALEKVNGRLDTLNETLKPIKATNERMNQLLVETAGKQ